MVTPALRLSRHLKDVSTLDDYFADACLIWQRDARERSAFDLWLHVVDHCSRVVEAIRKERPREVLDDLADTTMWLLSFVAQLHQSQNSIDLGFRITHTPADIIWNKYPAFCPACLDYEFTSALNIGSGEDPEEVVTTRAVDVNNWIKSRSDKFVATATPCQCLSRITFAEERHQRFHKINAKLDSFRLAYAAATRPKAAPLLGLSALEQMFSSMFEHAYQVFSVQAVAFHLLEEVGEVSQAFKDCYTYDADREPYSEALYRKRILKLEEELADVFSWIFALILKIKHIYYRDAQTYFQTLLPVGGGLDIKIDFVKLISLANIIWAKYGVNKEGQPLDNLVCSGCFSAPCACKRNLRINWATASIPVAG